MVGCVVVGGGEVPVEVGQVVQHGADLGAAGWVELAADQQHPGGVGGGGELAAVQGLGVVPVGGVWGDPRQQVGCEVFGGAAVPVAGAAGQLGVDQLAVCRHQPGGDPGQAPTGHIDMRGSHRSLGQRRTQGSQRPGGGAGQGGVVDVGTGSPAGLPAPTLEHLHRRPRRVRVVLTRHRSPHQRQAGGLEPVGLHAQVNDRVMDLGVGQ